MKVIKNYMYNLIYQVFIVFVPLITVPYISRVLGANGVGLNAYTNSVMSYFVLLANLGLLTYGNRSIAYCRDSNIERSKCFWEIVILQKISMIISFLFLCIFINIYGRYSNLILLQSIQIFATGIDIAWFFTGIEDFKKTVSRNMMIKILSLCMIFIFVKDADDLTKYILIVAGSTLIGNLTLWTFIKKYLVKVKWKDLKFNHHIKPVVALFLPQLTTSIFVSVNRIMLGNLSTINQTGFFDNSDKIVRVSLSLIIAVGIVMFPRIANNFHKGETEKVLYYLKNSFDIVNFISFPISFGIIIVSKPFSILFFGDSFLGIDKVLSISIISLIFMGWSSLIGQQFLVAVNEIRGVTVSMIISLACTIGLGFLLIPQFGAVGAAICATSGEAIISIIQILYLRKLVSLKMLFYDTWKFFISSIVMAILSLFLSNLSIHNFPKMIIGVLSGIVVYVIMLAILRPRIVKEGYGLIINKKSKF